MRLTTKLIIFSSLIFLTACDGVDRPNSYIWAVNCKAKQLRGYNLKTDFNDDGIRKPGAKPQIIALEDCDDGLNAWIMIRPALDKKDPLKDEGFAGIKAWIQQYRDANKKASE